MMQPFYLSREDWRDSTNDDLYQMYRLAVEQQKMMEGEMPSSDQTTPSKNNQWVPETPKEHFLLMNMIGVEGIPKDFLQQQAKKGK